MHAYPPLRIRAAVIALYVGIVTVLAWPFGIWLGWSALIAAGFLGIVWGIAVVSVDIEDWLTRRREQAERARHEELRHQWRGW